MDAEKPRPKRSGTNLADDGVVGGGDGVEDPFDALQLLLVAGGDPVERLVVVLKSAATFAAGNRKSVSATSYQSRRASEGRGLHVDGVGHLHVSHLHQPGEVHLFLHLPLAPHLH